MRRFFLLAGAVALAVGCGTVVVEQGQSSGTASGGGGATSSTTTTTTVTGDVGGGLVATSSSGGWASCNDPTLFFDISGDVPFQHLDATCEPAGYLIYGSAGPKPPPPPGPPQPVPTGAGLIACPVAGNFVLSLGASGQMWPGTSTQAGVHFMQDGAQWEESPAGSAVLQLDVVEPIGGVMEGSFEALVAPPPGTSGSPLKITGKFRVCHTYDQHLA